MWRWVSFSASVERGVPFWEVGWVGVGVQMGETPGRGMRERCAPVEAKAMWGVGRAWVSFRAVVRRVVRTERNIRGGREVRVGALVRVATVWPRQRGYRVKAMERCSSRVRVCLGVTRRELGNIFMEGGEEEETVAVRMARWLDWRVMWPVESMAAMEAGGQSAPTMGRRAWVAASLRETYLRRLQTLPAVPRLVSSWEEPELCVLAVRVGSCEGGSSEGYKFYLYI